ncbi:MAG: LCP family protein [Ruminococcus sp.]|nr:LCP family protein [Ruminococcus sp.]
MDDRYNGYDGYSGDEQLPGADDYYADQYRQQIREFSAMDNTNYFNSNVDFEFEQYPTENDAGYSQPPQRQPAARREYVHPKRAENQNRNAQRNARAAQNRQPRQDSRPQQRRQQPRQQAARPPQSQQRRRMETNIPVTNSGGSASLEEEKKKKITAKRVLITILAITVALFLILNIVLLYLVGKVNVVETGKRDDSIKAFMTDKNVKNILIIGSDTRDPEAKGRTDVMMIMSVNTEKKQITMTSLMRDMYLPLVGYYNDGTKMYDDEQPDGLYRNKLNSAYVFGGPELLMDTIKYNFGLEIDDYIYIDFSSFVSIVDSIGGIKVDVTTEEVEAMNECTREQNRLLGNPETQDYLQKGGSVELNGNQTLSFARMRRVGNADFQRTQRQRTVMTKIIEKVNSVGPIKKFSFLKAVLSSLTTNMSRTQLFFYGYKAPFYLGYEVKELRIPEDGDYEFGTHDGQSTLDIDIDKCRKKIQKAIFD